MDIKVKNSENQKCYDCFNELKQKQMRTREVEIGVLLGERGGKFPNMKEGMFSFLGHLCSAKPDSGIMPDGTGKAVPGKLEGEVNPDLALGQHCRVEPKARLG